MSNIHKKVSIITENSKAYAKLKSILISKDTSYDNNYNKNDLYELLRSFNTPNDLYGITGVAKNLAPILLGLEPIIQQENKPLMKKWLSACNDIHMYRTTILREIPSAVVKGNKDQLYRECTDNPIYSCIWQRATKTVLKYKYLTLQSYVVWAFIHLKLNKDNKKNKTKMYKWCLNVRKLSEEKYYSVVNNLPSGLVSLIKYKEKLDAVKIMFSVMPDKLTLIDDVLDMVEKTISGKEHYIDKNSEGENKPKKNTKKNIVTPKKTRGEMPKPKNLAAYDFEKTETINNVDIYNPPNITPKEKYNNTKSGLPPADYIGKHDRVKITSSQRSTGCYTLKDYALLRKDVVRVISVRNQSLVTQWDSLSLSDYLVISSVLFDTKVSLSTLNESEICIALMLLLWTGRPWKQLKKISLCFKDDNYAGFNDGVIYLVDEKSLLLPVCGDLPSRKLNDEVKAFAKNKEEFIKIRLPEIIHNLIDEFISLKINNKILFSKEINLNKLRKYIKEINLTHKTKITLSNAQGFLKLYISRMNNGGMIESAILTDNISPVDINPMHYSWFSQNKLANLYSATVQPLLSLLLKNKFTKIKNTTFDPSQNDVGVGSSIMPDKDGVKNLVRKLKASIRDTRNIELADRIVTYHNQYALYTACMLSYSTGSRATKYPFWLPSDIDITTGFAVISDKDSNDYYNSRLVWLPDVCVQQLKNYNEYMNVLMNRLPVIAPDLFTKLTEQLKNDSILRSRSSEIERQEDMIPYIFFMRDSNNRKKNSWIESSAEEIFRRIRGQLPLPLNVNRHYLRTRLREEGCPEEIVNAFMGHWHDGQEPFGKYSSLSPLTYRNILKKYLPKIIKLDGWESIQGDVLS